MGRHLRLIKKLNKIIEKSENFEKRKAAKVILRKYMQGELSLYEGEQWYKELEYIFGKEK